MTVQAVISLAQTGELRQLSLKDDTEAIIGYINLGLIELYKRFVLNTSEAVIVLQDHKTIYSLDNKDPDVSMEDDNFMYIVGAFGEAENGVWEELSVNDSEDLYGINTISYNKVQIPVATTGAIVTIIYVARPKLITVDDVASELPIPDQLVEPLLHYIGYRGHGSLDGNIQTESNTHYMRFEASCNKVRELGVGITADDMTTETRVYDRGFV